LPHRWVGHFPIALYRGTGAYIQEVAYPC